MGLLLIYYMKNDNEQGCGLHFPIKAMYKKEGHGIFKGFPGNSLVQDPSKDTKSPASQAMMP